MDFLDPRKRRRHNVYLMLGYGLTGIAIFLISVILIYGGSGYGINTKTGDVVQNGLLFVDSKPSGASIYLNNKIQTKGTGSRLVLPAGDYQLTLKKSGYRDWSRKFTLSEQAISRFAYPFLFPVTLTPQTLKTYDSQPGLVTESPDKHWLLVESSLPTSPQLTFDMYDTTKPTAVPQVLTLPATVLSAGSEHSFKAVEWAGNNDELLLEHNFGSGTEFIVFNRIDPITSFNVNRTFGLSPTQVNLRSKKTDQLYIFNQATGNLDLGNVSKASISPLLNGVLAFKPYGADIMIYVNAKNVAAGQVAARVWENGKTYPLFTFAAGDKYLIDAALFQDHWYYVAGSDKSDRVNIYKDPLSSVKDPQIAKAIPLIALPDSGAKNLSFSANNRFIGVESGQKFAVYDIETQNRYQYDLSAPLSDVMHWMDGHRYLGLSNGSVFVMDYDGINQQALVPASDAMSVFFDRDYNQMFSLAGAVLQRTDLRAGADIPKQ